MEKQISTHLLADNADRKESFDYFSQYTEAELNEYKNQLAETSLERNDVELEKKEVMQVFTSKLKTHKATIVKLLTNIRQKGEFVTEDCFVLIDETNREAGYYNAKGELVHQRALRPNEMQRNIFQLKTGTND